jgi:murein DD-endopeptidase MepM/ murein hydrolase activator NlpD
MGLDIAGPKGHAIVANRDGRVEVSGAIRGYGYSVILVHGGGIRTLYAHLEKDPGLGPGSQVAQGAVVGSLGNTGNAKDLPVGEMHLHFGVAEGPITSTAGTSWLNPADYLNNPCP